MKNLIPYLSFILIICLMGQARSAHAQLPTTDPQKRAAYEKLFEKNARPPAYYLMDEGRKWKYDIGMYKARSLRNKGWVLLVSGAAITAASFLVPSKENDITKEIFWGVGGAATVASIPCFIIAGNKKKNAQLILGNAAPAQAGTTSYFRPQVGIRLAL